MSRPSAIASAYPTSTSERLKPPDDLAGDARELFIDFVMAVPADHFRPSDAPLLVAYCHACILERTASAALKANGYVIDGKVSPCWSRRILRAGS